MQRIFTPLLDGRRPDHEVAVPAIDTGGGWRAAHRPQNPSTDPKEPYGGESSSVGTDHGWANCTMSAGAVAYAYEAHYSGTDNAPWGGDLRHKQDDMSGGTDLYDLKTAWSRYGSKSLTIRSGSGWDDVVKAHDEGRAIVIQGEGDCPGSGDFTGGHACCIGPEDNGSNWLWSDPDTTGWQWVTPGSIKAWAERLSTGIAFAVSRLPSAGSDDEMDAMNANGLDLRSTSTVVIDRDTDIWDAAGGGAHIATAKAGYRYPYIGVVVNGSRYAALINTALIYSDGIQRATILFIDRDDAHTEVNPVEETEEPAGDLAARDEEWRTWLLEGSPGS